MKVTTGIGSITLTAKAVESINGAAVAGDVSIGIAKVETATLTESVQQAVGDRPVYDFSVSVGGSEVSSFGGGSANISIPSSPQAGEDPNAIVVYYIDNSGSLQTVRGAYNAATGAVDFVTTHFSKYAVGYNKVSFTDVADDAWYSEAVTFIAARGITTGVGDNLYAPDST